jgi:hypothetical protein
MELNNLRALLYQLIHPWHWLTYGQNTSAVGLIVLVFYTLYTRRMMLIAQQTRRGELYPVLILQHTEVAGGCLEFSIVNVGGGPLLNAFEWGLQVSGQFKLGDTYLERPAHIDPHFVGTMVGESRLNLNSTIDGSELRVLQVIEGSDSVGGRHQFCILRSLVGPGKYEHAVRMVHPVEFFPFWRRVVWKGQEWRGRIKLIWSRERK